MRSADDTSSIQYEQAKDVPLAIDGNYESASDEIV
jgi:hypothetical protein